MADTEPKLRRESPAEGGAEPKLKRESPAESRAEVLTLDRPVRDTARPRVRIIPLLITLATIVIALALGWGMWDAYMGSPWTRDGTVRVYVVTMAPEVAGRIVELPVHDNQFVHKGDLLMVIDPINYRIAVDLADAAVKQADANAQNAAIQAERRARLTTLAVSQEEKQIYATQAVAAQAQL
ncbi:MAG TPA: biotin/lipoyl-binding protein, partial [Steroidobacteraceae bacterium]|nr:biotin/lipoyl-binding protein [Steroidobacteraceae bacterium]